MSKAGKIIKISIFGIFIAALIVLTIVFWDDLVSLRDETVRSQFMSRIQNLGFVGWLAMIGIQVGQIIVAFLPGEPVEILMGMMYGSLGGLGTCLLGILLGSVIVYLLAKLIGKPFISLFINLDDLNKFKFLKNKSKVEATIFFLFFIPGVPKDVLVYFAPMLKIKPWKFFLIATFARIPSVITSTIAGEGIGTNNWPLTIGVFAITGVIAIVGILINRWYMRRQNMKKYVIFDLDGTLLNTIGDLTLSINYVLSQMGLTSRSEEEVKQFLGNGIRVLIKRAAPDVSDETYEKCYKEFMDYYLNHLDLKTYPYEGIMEVLKELKARGCKIAIASNKHHQAVVQLSNKFFGDLVDIPVGVSAIIKPKPALDIINYITDEFKCQREDICYFGDSEVDIETCQAANLNCTCVSWGFRSKEQLEKAGATKVIDKTKEIIKIVEGE